MKETREIVLLQGVSGSGKSTYAKKLASDARGIPFVRVVSADDYFVSPSGTYAFDPAALPKAHGRCFRRFLDFIADACDGSGDALIIVDNTNTSALELAPYMAAVAAANDYAQMLTVRIVRVACDDLEAAAKRNQHGVSLGSIQGQNSRLRRFDTREGNPFGWAIEKVTL